MDEVTVNRIDGVPNYGHGFDGVDVSGNALLVEQKAIYEEGQQNEQGTEAEPQEEHGEQGSGEADVSEPM